MQAKLSVNAFHSFSGLKSSSSWIISTRSLAHTNLSFIQHSSIQKLKMFLLNFFIQSQYIAIHRCQVMQLFPYLFLDYQSIIYEVKNNYQNWHELFQLLSSQSWFPIFTHFFILELYNELTLIQIFNDFSVNFEGQNKNVKFLRLQSPLRALQLYIGSKAIL